MEGLAYDVRNDAGFPEMEQGVLLNFNGITMVRWATVKLDPFEDRCENMQG